MPSVSHSEVESYLSCRRKHYYQYGLSLKRREEMSGLFYGSAGHKVLEAFYREILASDEANPTRTKQKKAFDKALSKAEEAMAQLEADGWDDRDDRKMPLRQLLFDYYFPNEPLVKQGYLILAVEQEFNLEYDTENELRLPFVVDLIVKAPSGKTMIVDHKFVGQFYSPNDTELMAQLPKYIGAMRALGHRIDSGIYNLVKTYNYKTPPPPEKVLMDLHVVPNNVRVQQVFVDHISVAEEIQARKQLSIEEQDATAYRVGNKMVCQGCGFKDLCTTELIGGNTKLLIATEFEVRERRHFAEVSEEIDDDAA